jgi:GT2 family glycosyltransferase
MSILISVVIPTYRRDDLLLHCVERLLAQSLPADQYEIVVCDDAPAEATRRLVESLARIAGPRIRYVPVTGTQGPAGARNAGWRAAVGPNIAFTDDDCLPESGWLQAGLAALEGADAATGRTVVPLPDSPTDYELDTSGLATAEFITANCFVRREALQAVGGFDERFTAAWREDSDLHFSLLELGRRIVRTDNAMIIHPVRPAPWGTSLKQQRKGMFDPLLMRKHPALYAERILPFPWRYLTVVACLIALAVSLLASAFAVAVVAAHLWLGLTLEFAWRRLRRTSKAPRHVAEMLVTSALIPPISLYWRIRGWFRFRDVSPTATAGWPVLNTVIR